MDWEKLEEAERCELFARRLKEMSKDELMLRLHDAYNQLNTQREKHSNELTNTISGL
tara:strand:- start:44 stop:214 length:171 start_codon:yes stop_codon:yes gene_type:complete